MFSSSPIFLLHCLSVLSIVLSTVNRCAGATFDARSKFSWIDSSCDSLIDRLNDAGDDYNALVQAALTNLEGGSPTTELGKSTFKTYFGSNNPQIINIRYTGLQSAFGPQPKGFGLYCDGSAFEWVTTFQEGPKKGEEIPGGAWHAKEGRYDPTKEPLYEKALKPDQRTDICIDPQGRSAQGVSAKRGKHIILCPDAFKPPVKPTVPTSEQTIGTSLDDLTSTGAVLLHEVTHCLYSTEDTRGGGSVDGVMLTASMSYPVAFKNANNWMYYAMASLANKNAWVVGKAQATNNFGFKAPQAPPTNVANDKRGAIPLDLLDHRAPVIRPTTFATLPRYPLVKARTLSPQTIMANSSPEASTYVLTGLRPISADSIGGRISTDSSDGGSIDIDSMSTDPTSTDSASKSFTFSTPDPTVLIH